MAVDVTYSLFNDCTMWLKDGVSEDSIIKVAETKNIFRKFKRAKKVQRNVSDIILELDDDETAVVSCCFKKGKIIVWRPVLIRTYDINRQRVAILAYVCATREGVFCYPAADIKKLLLEEGDTVAVLDSWKEDQRISREQISEMIETWKRYNERERIKVL